MLLLRSYMLCLCSQSPVFFHLPPSPSPHRSLVPACMVVGSLRCMAVLEEVEHGEWHEGTTCSSGSSSGSGYDELPGCLQSLGHRSIAGRAAPMHSARMVVGRRGSSCTWGMRRGTEGSAFPSCLVSFVLPALSVARADPCLLSGDPSLCSFPLLPLSPLCPCPWQPVHRWILRHVYLPACNAGYSKVREGEGEGMREGGREESESV